MADLIGGFVRELRRRGLAISPSERIDAGRALRAVGLESRALFRAALRATLAKTADAQAVFDAAFERHFAPPRPGSARGRGRERKAGPGEGARRGPEAPAAGRRQPHRPPPSPRERPAETPSRRGRPPEGSPGGKPPAASGGS